MPSRKEYGDRTEKEKILDIIEQINKGGKVWIGKINRKKALTELNINEYENLLKDMCAAFEKEWCHPIAQLKDLSPEDIAIVMPSIIKKGINLYRFHLNEASLDAALEYIEDMSADQQGPNISIIFHVISTRIAFKISSSIAKNKYAAVKDITIFPNAITKLQSDQKKPYDQLLKAAEGKITISSTTFAEKFGSAKIGGGKRAYTDEDAKFKNKKWKNQHAVGTDDNHSTALNRFPIESSIFGKRSTNEANLEPNDQQSSKLIINQASGSITYVNYKN